MEISELVILSLIIFASLLFIRLIRMRYFPSNINPPMPTKKLIGGCEGTRFGCCPDKQTSCIDEECSNCLLDPTPDLGTLENSSQKNEENKRDFRIKNENLRSIEDKIKNLKSDKTTLEDEIQDLENQLKDPLGVANEEWIKRELEIKREELSKYDKKIETLEKEEETEEAELSETAKELSLSEQFLKKMNEMLDKINFVKSSDPAEPAADEPAADEPADDEPDAGITNPGLREEINERASENNTGDSRNVTRYNIGSGSELEESRKCAVPIQNFGEDNAILPVGYILNTRSTSENDIPCAWLPENNKSDCQIWKCDTVNGYEGNAEQNQCALPEQSCLNEYSDPTSSLAIKNCAKEYTLSGCTKPNKCISPTDTTGYKNIVELELDKDNFDVTAECADGLMGYVENATATVCSNVGEEYTLNGCFLPKCGNTDGNETPFNNCEEGRVYDNQKANNTDPNDTNCCKDASVPFVPTRGLIAEGGGAFNNCEEGRVYDSDKSPVENPSDNNCCKDLGCKFDGMSTLKGKRGVTINYPSGTVNDFYCPDNDKQKHLLKCDNGKLQAYPSFPDFIDTNYAEDGIITDIPDWVGTPESGPNGEYVSDYTGCTKPNKCISPTDTTGYKNIVERELDKDNFDVTAECATGFEGTVEAKVCTKPGEPYTLSSCIAAAPFVPIKLPRGIFESQSFPFVTENVCTAPPCNEDGCSFSFWEMTNDGAKGRGFEWNDTNKKYEVKSWGGTGPKPYYQVSKTNQDYTYTWRDQDGIVGHFKSKMERPKLNDGLYEVEWDNADGGSHFYRAETDSDSGNPRLKIYTDKAETIPVAPGELNWSCQSTRYQIGVDVQDRGGSRITIETGKNDMTGADVQLGTYRVIADLDGWSKMEGTITPVPAAAQNQMCASAFDPAAKAVDTTGYVDIIETSLNKDNFNVTAACDTARGYTGQSGVGSVCTAGKPYTLSGCAYYQNPCKMTEKQKELGDPYYENQYWCYEELPYKNPCSMSESGFAPPGGNGAWGTGNQKKCVLLPSLSDGDYEMTWSDEVNDLDSNNWAATGWERPIPIRMEQGGKVLVLNRVGFEYSYSWNSTRGIYEDDTFHFKITESSNGDMTITDEVGGAYVFQKAPLRLVGKTDVTPAPSAQGSGSSAPGVACTAGCASTPVSYKENACGCKGEYAWYEYSTSKGHRCTNQSVTKTIHAPAQCFSSDTCRTSGTGTCTANTNICTSAEQKTDPLNFTKVYNLVEKNMSLDNFDVIAEGYLGCSWGGLSSQIEKCNAAGEPYIIPPDRTNPCP